MRTAIDHRAGPDHPRGRHVLRAARRPSYVVRFRECGCAGPRRGIPGGTDWQPADGPRLRRPQAVRRNSRIASFNVETAWPVPQRPRLLSSDSCLVQQWSRPGQLTMRPHARDAAAFTSAAESEHEPGCAVARSSNSPRSTRTREFTRRTRPPGTSTARELLGRIAPSGRDTATETAASVPYTTMPRTGLSLASDGSEHAAERDAQQVDPIRIDRRMSFERGQAPRGSRPVPASSRWSRRAVPDCLRRRTSRPAW